MNTLRLTVSIDSDMMLIKLKEIEEKATELRRLVDEFRAMSGELAPFDSSILPTVQEEK